MYNYLHVNDFDTLQANTANIETVVMEKIVPIGHAFMLPSEALQIFLAVKESFTGNGSATTFTTTKGIVKSPNLADDGGNVAVFTGASGGSGGSRATVSSVNYTTGVVTLSAAPGNGVAVDIYYLVKAGNLKIRAAHPNKTSRFKTLFARALNNVHVVDQYNNRSAPKIQNPFLLPERYALQIMLNGAQALNWDANNIISQVAIPYTQIPMSQLPKDIKNRVNALLI